MTESKTVIDASVLEQQLGGDEEFLAEVVKDYRAQRKEISAQLGAAYERGEWAEISSLAHRLKGSLLTLGARASADAAWQVESLARDQASQPVGEALAALERELDRLDPALLRLVETGFGSD